MKRIIALLLVLLMLLPMMFSCKKDEVESETMGSQDDTKELPVIVEDLDGKTFNVLSVNNPNEYGYNRLTEEDLSGSVLEQAVYTRNTKVYERLNANMTVDNSQTSATKMLDSFRTVYFSGDLSYDFIYGYSQTMTGAAVEGLCAPVDAVSEVIDTSDEWWEASAIKSSSINGKSYGMVGQAALHFYESIYIMAYNVDRATELNIPDIAQLALDGGWTLEKLNEYVKRGYTDDGPEGSNSIKDGYDRFGIGTNKSFITSAILASGETILDYNKTTNYPTFNGFSERMISIYDFVRANFCNSNYAFMSNNDANLLSNGQSFHDLFVSGNTLFYSEPMGSIAKLKNSEFEYSVLPMPKWSDNEKYLSVLAEYTFMFYVPANTADFRPVAIFLDNLNYQSMVDVTPVYMEDVVSLQRLKNSVSYEVMQKIILKSDKVVSLVAMYNWSDVFSNIQQYALQNKGIGSLGASLKRTMAGEIEKSIGPK